MRYGLTLEQIKGMTVTQINIITGSLEELDLTSRENEFVSDLIAAQGDKKAIGDLQAAFQKSKAALKD